MCSRARSFRFTCALMQVSVYVCVWMHVQVCVAVSIHVHSYSSIRVHVHLVCTDFSSAVPTYAFICVHVHLACTDLSPAASVCSIWMAVILGWNHSWVLWWCCSSIVSLARPFVALLVPSTAVMTCCTISLPSGGVAHTSSALFVPSSLLFRLLRLSTVVPLLQVCV